MLQKKYCEILYLDNIYAHIYINVNKLFIIFLYVTFHVWACVRAHVCFMRIH